MSGPRLAEVFPRLLAVESAGCPDVAGLRSLILLLYRARGTPAPPSASGVLSGLNARSLKWFRGNGTFFNGLRLDWVGATYTPWTGNREGPLPISEQVSEYLPFMRRYARALTGAQSSGDAYVAAALEAILADRGALDRTPRPRAMLYKVLTKI